MPVLHLPKIDPAIKFSFGSTTARGTLLEMTDVPLSTIMERKFLIL